MLAFSVSANKPTRKKNVNAQLKEIFSLIDMVVTHVREYLRNRMRQIQSKRVHNMMEMHHS